MKKHLLVPNLPEHLLTTLPPQERTSIRLVLASLVFNPQETIFKGIGFDFSPRQKQVKLVPSGLQLKQSTPTLTPEQAKQALERREKVRKLIGVVDKGLLPPTREEFNEQLARQAESYNSEQ